MKVNRENLLNDLETVKAGLSPREFIEQSSCFVFQDGMVMTFNDEVACRKKIELNVTGAVQANALLSILSKIDDPELLVRQNDKGELEFRGKSKGFGIMMDKDIFLPIDKVELPEKWRPLPKEFTEAVGLVQHCVSTDETKFMMTCVHIHPNFIEGCDNTQVMHVRLNTTLKERVLVRVTSLEAITSLGMDRIALTKSWIHFRNQNGLIYSCRRYDEEYPSLQEVINFKGHKITIPKGLADGCERAAVFAEDKSGEPMVSIRLSNGKIRLEGIGLSGWYRQVNKVAYDGPSMEFVIAPDLLKHISEKYSDAQLSRDKLKVEGGSWTYVTVLGQKQDTPEEEEESDEND